MIFGARLMPPARLGPIIAMAFSGGFANGADNPASALEAPTVEVVGTMPLPGVGTPINQVPANVQTVTGADLSKQNSLNVADYLTQNLGSVSFTNNNANPFQADVNFRGFTASPLLGTPQGLSVFQDGVRINEAFGDTVNRSLSRSQPFPASH